MVSFEYVVKDALGIHARPAGMIVKEAIQFQSNIRMKTPKKEVDLKRIMGVMGAGVKCNDLVTVYCDGEDEGAAKEALEHFFKTNL